MQRLLILSLLLHLSFFSYSQDNYTIKSQLKAIGLPDDLAGFADLEINTFMKGEKSKTETIGAMMNQTAFFDGKSLALLMTVMGEKIACVMNKEQLEENKKNSVPSKKPTIKYTNEKKKIAGFDCVKVLIITEEDPEPENGMSLAIVPKKQLTHVAWVTDKLKPIQEEMAIIRSQSTAVDLKELKGVILEMESEMKENGMDVKLIMTTSEISTKTLDDSVFNPNTEGYKQVDFKELMTTPKNLGK